MSYDAMLFLLFEFVSFVYAFERRQVGAAGGNGVLTAQNFLRRGFHACECASMVANSEFADFTPATVANGWVYIDGGEFSYKDSNDTTQFRYCQLASGVRC